MRLKSTGQPDFRTEEPNTQKVREEAMSSSRLITMFVQFGLMVSIVLDGHLNSRATAPVMRIVSQIPICKYRTVGWAFQALPIRHVTAGSLQLSGHHYWFRS